MLVWSLLSPGLALAIEIMLNILKKEFWADYDLSPISRNLHNFSTIFFSMYRGILEVKNDTSILLKNDSFTNKMCCRLTPLFTKTKIYFCRFIFANKQINKNFFYRFLFRL